MKFIPKYFLTIVILTCLSLIFLNIALGAGMDDLNPLGVKGIEGINEVIGRIVKAILGIVGAFAMLMIVTGGMYMLTAAGNQDKVKKGKDILTWSIIGIMVVLSSYMIVDYLITGITGEGGSGGGTTPGGGGSTDSSNACTEAGHECKDTGCTADDGICIFDWSEEYWDDTGAECFISYTIACPEGNNVLCCHKPDDGSGGGGEEEEEEEINWDCDDAGGSCQNCYDKIPCLATLPPAPGCVCDKASLEAATSMTCDAVGASAECGADNACCK